MRKPAVGQVNEKIGRYRWTICALLFLATTINYLDRAVISLLKPELEIIFGWTESDYGNIVMAFQLAYAVGMLIAGRFIDWAGTKVGYALSLVLWSLAAIGHAFVRTSTGFLIARGFLGLTEAGNFPAAIKTTAEWFPKKERALATGIFNSGTNVGAILAPLTVPFIAAKWGWQEAFVITGAIGFLWLILWFIFYDIPSRQKRLSQREYDYIHSDKDEQDEAAEDIRAGTEAKRIPWGKLLFYRQAWAVILGKFITDPIWWFFLFWLPAFLNAEYGLTGTAIALPVSLVYTMSAFGSIFGGWLPYYFMRRNWPAFKARKVSMLIYALFVTPVIFAQLFGTYNMWLAICIIGVATAAHQAWSANIFTTVSDMFPKKAVASVTGMAGMAGALGGLLISFTAGHVFDHFKGLGKLQTGYYIMFVICGLGYLTAWGVMHLLAPRFRRVNL